MPQFSRALSFSTKLLSVMRTSGSAESNWSTLENEELKYPRLWYDTRNIAIVAAPLSRLR
ncbi:hypothetical protein V1527DRAFT_460428 [Lipomyces starkeyi]